MTLSINQKEVILNRLETLTEEQQDSVLEFIEFLRYQTQKKDEHPPKTTSSMSADKATKKYAIDVHFSPGDIDIKKTKTWQLCGSLKVTNPDPEYSVNREETDQIMTNY